MDIPQLNFFPLSLSPSDKSESLADTLKDATHEELLDALRTVEADCIKNKESLDRLFALIVGHTPELLSVMAEVQQPDGYVNNNV